MEKIKSFLAQDTYFYTVLVVLVALSAYGLGRQSVLLSAEQPATVCQTKRTDIPTPQITEVIDSKSVEVVASKNGTRYYLPSCSGASRIAEENIVRFASAQTAREAGYTPAANCAGLE